jgi:hypothetical protein
METTFRDDNDSSWARPAGRNRRSWSGGWRCRVASGSEVFARVRRWTFTAQYKQEILAAYEAAPTVRKARSCGGRACIPV